PSSTPTSTVTDTPSLTPTSAPTDTVTATPTLTGTPTLTVTATSAPTDTPADTPTDTPTDTPADTPTLTPTDTPIPTNTATETPTLMPTIGAGCDVDALISTIQNAPPGSTIELAASCTYTLTTVNNTDIGPNGLPVIGKNLTINGHGSTITRDSSAPAFRILESYQHLTLNDLTISGGLTPDGLTNGSYGGGGGYTSRLPP